jgi:hypothetical protein
MNVACGWPVAALFAALALNTAACRGILGIHDLTGGESDAATPREVSTSDEVDGEAAARPHYRRRLRPPRQATPPWKAARHPATTPRAIPPECRT